MEMKDRQKTLLDALRSGKYQFGRGKLRRKTDEPDMCLFCVAGVMCEVYRLFHLESSKWISLENGKMEMGFRDEMDEDKNVYDYITTTPNTVIDFFGLPRYHYNAKEVGLNSNMCLLGIIDMNDSNMYEDTFQVIADFLEEGWGLK